MMAMMADDDKPREKALAQGIGVLTDAELLAILLRVGCKGRSVLSVSREILRQNDNDLAILARRSPRELAKMVPGMGPTKAITVTAALELGVRACGAIAQKQLREKQITGSQALYDYMWPKMETLLHEEFWLIALNQRLLPITAERISQGGMSATVVDLRMLFKKALDLQAVAIAVCHNHPSGNVKPSMQDDELTRRITAGAKTLDLKVVDHIIVAQGAYYSYADESRL